MTTTTEKQFTFEFHFTNPTTGRSDEIQFCASTQSEAISLFTAWCQQDANFKKVPDPNSINVVFNKDDADELGENYGTPEEYKE